jgi:oxaloacetate decarboxylase beta subunit
MNLVLQTIQGIWNDSGFKILAGIADNWQSLVMIILSCVLLYLGIVKKFEPLLLVGIAFGMLLTNLPTPAGDTAIYNPDLWSAFMDETSPFYHSYGHIIQHQHVMDLQNSRQIEV